SIEQKTAGSNPRSTVGTITEILDYLRVLYARVGVQHCVLCDKPVRTQSAENIASQLAALPQKTRIFALVSLLANRKDEHRELLEQARRDGYVRLRVDGEIVDSEELLSLDKRKKHHVEAVVDRLVLGAASKSRITESVEKALEVGSGSFIAHISEPGAPGKDVMFSRHSACCGRSYPELSPQSFSFNSPQGMCPDCSGLGTRVGMDPDLVIPNKSLTLDEGAIAAWGADISKKDTGWGNGIRLQILRKLKVSLNK